MARRMFSDKIVDTDAFLDMPISSQLLYFHLAMRADDDGFIANPKKIMRILGAGEDDLKVLGAKKFIIGFESGVIVIKHWLIHNLIRGDRYNPTQYVREKEMLVIDPKTRKYSLIKGDIPVIPNGNQMATQVRLGKGSIGKDRLGKVNTEQSSEDIEKIIFAFKEVNPSYKTLFGRPPQRNASKRLVATHGLDRVIQVIGVLAKSNKVPFIPTITTPVQLEDKWAALEAGLTKKKNELTANKREYV